MATIRFRSPGVDTTVTAATGEDAPRTLLAVAQAEGVPLPYRCETGDCASCLVHVDTRSAGARGIAPMTEKEAALLQQMFFTTAAEIAEAESQGICPPVRLGCQYELRDEEIVAFFEQD
jgi:ferredoxin